MAEEEAAKLFERTHFCVVQCYSQLGWPVIKGGKPIWNLDPHQGFVDAFFFTAIWHALGGKGGLQRPGLDMAVTALAGGELTVGDVFWARRGENGVTSDAFLEALVACKDRVSTPEFRWLPQAPPQSVANAHTLLLNSVVHYAERLESDAVVLFGWNLCIPKWAEATYGKLLEHTAHAQPAQVVVVVPTDFGFDGQKDRDGILQEAVLQCFQGRRRIVKVDLVSEDTHPQFRFSCHHTFCSIFSARCRTETCAVLQVVLLAVHHLSVVLEVHAETSLWTSRIPMMSSVCRTGDCRPTLVMRCTSAGHTRKERSNE